MAQRRAAAMEILSMRRSNLWFDEECSLCPAPDLNAEAQGLPYLLFLTSFDAECDPHRVGLLIVL